METPEQRKARLTAHAQLMRQRRSEKREATPASHVCQPDPVHLQLQRTSRLLQRLAPTNTAPIPMAMALEDGRWTVDLHIRTLSVEYEATGEAGELDNAIASARTGLLKTIREEANESTEGEEP